MEGASQECLLHSCSSDPDLQQLELSSEATDDHHIESKVLPSPLDAQQSLFHTHQQSPFHAQQSPFHSHAKLAHRRTGSGGSLKALSFKQHRRQGSTGSAKFNSLEKRPKKRKKDGSGSSQDATPRSHSRNNSASGIEHHMPSKVSKNSSPVFVPAKSPLKTVPRSATKQKAPVSSLNNNNTSSDSSSVEVDCDNSSCTQSSSIEPASTTSSAVSPMSSLDLGTRGGKPLSSERTSTAYHNKQVLLSRRNLSELSGVLSGLSGLSITLSDTEPATESNDGDCESDGGDDKSCKLQSTPSPLHTYTDEQSASASKQEPLEGSATPDYHLPPPPPLSLSSYLALTQRSTVSRKVSRLVSSDTLTPDAVSSSPPPMLEDWEQQFHFAAPLASPYVPAASTTTQAGTPRRDIDLVARTLSSSPVASVTGNCASAAAANNNGAASFLSPTSASSLLSLSYSHAHENCPHLVTQLVSQFEKNEKKENKNTREKQEEEGNVEDLCSAQKPVPMQIPLHIRRTTSSTTACKSSSPAKTSEAESTSSLPFQTSPQLGNSTAIVRRYFETVGTTRKPFQHSSSVTELEDSGFQVHCILIIIILVVYI